MKWNVLTDKDGKPTAAGFTLFEVGVDETVVEYDDVDKDVMKALKARKSKKSDCCEALAALDPSASTGALKTVIEFLQEKHG